MNRKWQWRNVTQRTTHSMDGPGLYRTTSFSYVTCSLFRARVCQCRLHVNFFLFKIYEWLLCANNFVSCSHWYAGYRLNQVANAWTHYPCILTQHFVFFVRMVPIEKIEMTTTTKIQIVGTWRVEQSSWQMNRWKVCATKITFCNYTRMNGKFRLFVVVYIVCSVLWGLHRYYRLWWWHEHCAIQVGHTSIYLVQDSEENRPSKIQYMQNGTQ